jgi:hypothetical protein
LIPAIGVAGLGSQKRLSITRLVGCVIGLATLAALLGRLWIGTMLTADSVQACSDHLLEALHELRPRPDELYVDWGGCFPYELLFGSKQVRALEPMRMLALGCTNQTPINKERSRQYHIDNVFHALFTRPHVRVIGRGTTIVEMICYASEHWHRRIRYQEVMHRKLGGYPKIDPLTGDPKFIRKDLIIYELSDDGPASPVSPPGQSGIPDASRPLEGPARFASAARKRAIRS